MMEQPSMLELPFMLENPFKHEHARTTLHAGGHPFMQETPLKAGVSLYAGVPL